MQIKALTAFSDGVLSMYDGEIADVETTKANALIADGYAEEYVEPIVPTGTKSITQNGEVDVTEYATANVNVPQPSGTIEITECGTVDVSAYASATVNIAAYILDLNVGEGEGGGTSWHAKGTVVTLVAATPPAGYTFAGWATTQGATEPDVGETYKVMADTTLYAVYTAQ